MTSGLTSSAQATINLIACRHNLSIAKQTAPKSKCIAIIKANAYGHGMIQVAKALTDADAFGVARLDEALQLHNANINAPILLLEGFSSEKELEIVSKHQFESVIHNEEQLQLLEKSKFPAITIVLKINSGMHRLGFEPAAIPGIVERLDNMSSVKKPYMSMTHLANADDKKDDKSVRQIDIFYKSLESLSDIETSIANSAGILGWPQSHASYNRPGIMLYGVSPFLNSTASDHGLKPVMTLSSTLISVKNVKKGESIGYGGAYVCEKDMTIGVITIGYGDGYPRHAKTGTPILVNGKRCALLGRVSMDMICVDLSKQAEAKVNDEVILWGEGLPIEEIADCSDTIAYELLCGVTQRVNFKYT